MKRSVFVTLDSEYVICMQFINAGGLCYLLCCDSIIYYNPGWAIDNTDRVPEAEIAVPFQVMPTSTTLGSHGDNS